MGIKTVEEIISGWANQVVKKDAEYSPAYINSKIVAMLAQQAFENQFRGKQVDNNEDCPHKDYFEGH